MTIGIKQHLTHRLVNEVEKWLKRNGQEWTISRLKDAKAYYLSKLAGQEPEMEHWWKQVGPSEDRRFKSNWLNLPQESEKQLVRALCACNAYTLFINSGDPTEKQLSKFYKSVEQDKYSLSNPRQVTELLRGLADSDARDRVRLFAKSIGCSDTSKVKFPVYLKGQKRKLPQPSHFSEFIYSEEKNAPVVSRENKGVESEMKWVFDNISSPAVMGLFTRYRGLSSMVGVTPLLRSNKLKINTHSDVAGGGNIAYIQEPGFKLRAVANPFRIHQVVLEPLKKQIMEFLRKMPTDCTHDQDSGQTWIQAKLAEGRTAHAVDLSDATNNIPLEPQIISMVTYLNLDNTDKTTSDILSYFIEVSRSTWKTPEGKLTSWTLGQPMGLGPSFGSFALWHNWTLRIAHSTSGSQYSWDDSFRVIGDDVVIACDDTHRRYREILSIMDIPVSEAKCISSNKCTEFAGKVITPTSSYPIPKWKSLSDRNFMDVLKLFGPQAMKWCKPRQRAVAKILAPIPECYGGLGWNPKGLPMEDRIIDAINLGLLDDSPEVDPARDLTQAMIRNINKVCYHGDVSLLSRFLYDKFNTSPTSTESRVLRLSENKTISITQKLRILKALRLHSDVNASVSEDVGLEPGPVLTSGDPRPKTQLENWESKLLNTVASVEAPVSQDTSDTPADEQKATPVSEPTKRRGPRP
jgi:hypothetical protein